MKEVAKNFKCSTSDNTKPKISKVFFSIDVLSFALLIFNLLLSPVEHSKFLAILMPGEQSHHVFMKEVLHTEFFEHLAMMSDVKIK